MAVNRRLLIMRVRNWKPAKTPPTPWSALPYTVTKNMLLLPDMTSISPNLRPYSLVFRSQTATTAMAVTNENSFATVSAVAVVADALSAPCASAVAMTAA